MAEYKKITLPNGLKLILYRMSGANSITVEIGVKAGPAYEQTENSGMAHFLEHMLFEGTKKFPDSKKLALFIEKNGGKGWAVTNKDNVSYGARVPADKMKIAFDYLRELVFNPLLPMQSIQSEKQMILEEHGSKIDTPSEYIWDLWFEFLYGKKQSLGNPITGNTKAIKRINKTDLNDYMSKYYSPKNMVAVIAGNFNFQEAEREATKALSYKKTFTEVKISSPKIVSDGRNIKVVHRRLNQIHSISGFLTNVAYNHPDRLALMLIADLLGEGATSRLYQSLVYDSGLVYALSAEYWSILNSGMLCIYTSFSPHKFSRVNKLINDTIKKLRDKKMPEGELTLTKEKNVASILFVCESTDVMADYIIGEELMSDNFTPLEKMSSKIKSITPEIIQKTAAKYFTEENFRQVILGNKKDLKNSY